MDMCYLHTKQEKNILNSTYARVSGSLPLTHVVVVICIYHTAIEFSILDNDLDEETSLHALLHSTEIPFFPNKNEVVPIHNTKKIAGGMLVAANTSFAAGQAHVGELISQKCFPSCRGITVP